MDKSVFTGKIISIQPRIRLIRSFDESSHSYLGYSITLEGEFEDLNKTYSIGIGKAAQRKHQFRVNDIIGGECVPVPDKNAEPVEYYKVSRLQRIVSGKEGSISAPWELVPPELEVYRERGHRRLSARTYETKCSSCMWGAKMPVEIIIDNWNPQGQVLYRFETFCYGPRDCNLYKAGPNRKVPGRKGMVYVEEDWVDELNIEHRDLDE